MLIRRNDTCVHLYTYRSTYLLSTCLSEMYLVLVPGTRYLLSVPGYPETPASPMMMVEFAIATHEIRCLASFQVSSATFLCTYVPVPVPVPGYQSGIGCISFIYRYVPGYHTTARQSRNKYCFLGTRRPRAIVFVSYSRSTMYLYVYMYLDRWLMRSE